MELEKQGKDCFLMRIILELRNHRKGNGGGGGEVQPCLVISMSAFQPLLEICNHFQQKQQSKQFIPYTSNMYIYDPNISLLHLLTSLKSLAHYLYTYMCQTFLIKLYQKL